MSYATVAQCRSRIDTANLSTQIEQLSRTTNTTEQNTFLEAYLEEASGLIDAYLDTKYTTPVTTAADNAMLRGICLNIAICEIFKRGSGDMVPSKYRENYKEAISRLDQIAKGEISVPGVSAKIKNTSIYLECDTPVFTEEEMETYF